MTLQQLRYLIAVAEHSSISGAARSLYVSQSSLSVAVKELEEELGVPIFNRSSKGITLTGEGIELLGYARQVIEQADLMIKRYSKSSGTQEHKLAVSSQHYAFVVQAFTGLANSCKESNYEFVLRETRTADIIEDVRTFRSELGVLYLSTYNVRVVGKRLEDEGLRFTSLFRAKPHAFLRKGHPLAERTSLRIEDLAPYPRLNFEQGPQSSFYYSEEPLASLPHSRRIVASDRATLTGLLRDSDSFLVSTGIRSDEMFDRIVSVPIDSDEVMDVGYVTNEQRVLSDLARAFLDELFAKVRAFDGAVTPSKAVREGAQQGEPTH